MMSFRELIAEAAANKVTLTVTMREDDAKDSTAIIADFAPADGAGREFSARIDHYTAQTIMHGKFCKVEQPAATKPATDIKSAADVTKATKAPVAKKVSDKTATKVSGKKGAAKVAKKTK